MVTPIFNDLLNDHDGFKMMMKDKEDHERARGKPPGSRWPQIGHADKPCPCTLANRKKYPPSKVLVAETSAQCSARLIVHVRACVCVRMCMLASSRECVRACVSSCVRA